jgi:hypothetical protein
MSGVGSVCEHAPSSSFAALAARERSQENVKLLSQRLSAVKIERGALDRFGYYVIC